MCAFTASRKHSGEAKIQPDDSRRFRPDKIRRASVVAVDDPSIPRCRRLYALSKNVVRNLGPIRTPIEGVEFHVGTTQNR